MLETNDHYQSLDCADNSPQLYRCQLLLMHYEALDDCSPVLESEVQVWSCAVLFELREYQSAKNC